MPTPNSVRQSIEAVAEATQQQAEEGPTIEIDGTTTPIRSLSIEDVLDLFTKLHRYPSVTMDQRVELAMHLQRMQKAQKQKAKEAEMLGA